MRLFAFLLFISAANLALCDWDDVGFIAAVLKPDLDAILKYHEKVDKNIPAFIHWPNGITFSVQAEEIHDETYLRVDGSFRIFTVMLLSDSYDALYYSKNGQFHLKNSNSAMKPIKHTSIAYYEQPSLVEKGDSYLSVHYKSMDEVQEAIKPFFSSNEDFLKKTSEKSSSKYLATWNEPTQHFLEYTLSSDQPPILSAAADGGLLLLVAKVENGKLNVQGNLRSPRLVFDRDGQTVLIPNDSHSAASPNVENVWGVRMDSVGFLAEVRSGKVKMLSEGDLDRDNGGSPSKHTMYAMNLLHKTSNTEPKKSSCDSADEECLSLQPKSVKFQVFGHILVKRVNYLDDNETAINGNCPYVIENESSDANFLFQGVPSKALCTDDSKLWIDGKSSSVLWEMDIVTLLYSRMKIGDLIDNNP